MFLLNELIVFSPLVAYAFFRVLRLCPRGRARLAWSGVFLLAVLAFPAAESLAHRGAEGWLKSVMLAGYLSWPWLIYLVLSVILVDLGVGAGRLLRLLDKERIRSLRVRSVQLAIVLALPVLVVGGGILNFNRLHVKTYTIDVPRKSSTLRELKMVFAADFHLGVRTSRGFLDKFADKVNALEPDVILLGGDVLEGDRHGEAEARFEASFRRLRSKYGVFGVFGNHEHYGGRAAVFYERAGIRLLQDEVLRVDDAFYLAGRNDMRARKRKAAADLLAGTPDDLPVIVLDHRPTDLENVSRTIADIQLSGHTHYGQLFPINYIISRRYELSWGYKRKSRTHFFVTSGVQLWGPPVRTAGRSEILLIRVRFRDADAPGEEPRPPSATSVRATDGKLPPDACTAFVLRNGEAVLLARNFDGPDGVGLICVNKKGVIKEAFDPAAAGAPGAAPLRWTSKYGSVTFNRLGREFPLGGMNEAGLAIEGIGGPADYPEDDGRPALDELQWIQYQLDTARAVKDVLAGAEAVRMSRLAFDLHYLVADRKGHAAVVEVVKGGLVAYSGQAMPAPVLTEEAYAESVRALGSRADLGEKPAASNRTEPAERFVRAAAFMHDFETLGQPPFVDDAFVALKAVDRDDTQWSIAYNLPRRLVFFKTKIHRRYKIIGLDRLDLSCATPALILPAATDESWDLTARFKPYDAAQNRRLLEIVLGELAASGALGAASPERLLEKLAAYPDSCRCGDRNPNGKAR